jgi:transcriptional regulator with XRE-family HTH domain
MTNDKKSDFGPFARAKRLSVNVGLREAARAMGVSATYLSRVENNIDPPSPDLINLMAKLYGVTVEDLTSHAKNRSATAAAHGRAIQNSAELRAFYRVVSRLDPEEIDRVLREILKSKGHSDEEIEGELIQLKEELPRLSKGQEDLLASHVHPRRLSARRIAKRAESMLASFGLNHESYFPPTPIERLAESTAGIRYRVDRLTCKKSGEPLVLGLTGWNDQGEREITMNGVLADSQKSSDEARFNFTLAHELFHAIEHLPLMPVENGLTIARAGVVDISFDKPLRIRMSNAERAVSTWAANEAGPRILLTDEDWREWQANTFSTALLMPGWAVVREFSRRSGEDYVELQDGENIRERALEIAGAYLAGDTVYSRSLCELFGVSRQAMAIRLIQLRLVREKLSS